MMAWIGVDMDGTLVEHGTGDDFPGPPLEPMLRRVREWLARGIEVRIMSARAAIPEQHDVIARWCEQHGLPRLPLTDRKDFGLIELWDDRAIRVERNTGLIAGQDREGRELNQ